jgi:GAF domain-containing protein
VVVLGIDGLDPEILAETIALYPERMRTSARLAAEQGIHSARHLDAAAEPGRLVQLHHRSRPGRPRHLRLHPPRPTRAECLAVDDGDGTRGSSLFGEWKLPTGGETTSNRTGEAFWTILARNGIPRTSGACRPTSPSSPPRAGRSAG